MGGPLAWEGGGTVERRVVLSSDGGRLRLQHQIPRIATGRHFGQTAGQLLEGVLDSGGHRRIPVDRPGLIGPGRAAPRPERMPSRMQPEVVPPRRPVAVVVGIVHRGPRRLAVLPEVNDGAREHFAGVAGLRRVRGRGRICLGGGQVREVHDLDVLLREPPVLVVGPRRRLDQVRPWVRGPPRGEPQVPHKRLVLHVRHHDARVAPHRPGCAWHAAGQRGRRKDGGGGLRLLGFPVGGGWGDGSVGGGRRYSPVGGGGLHCWGRDARDCVGWGRQPGACG